MCAQVSPAGRGKIPVQKQPPPPSTPSPIQVLNPRESSHHHKINSQALNTLNQSRQQQAAFAQTPGRGPTTADVGEAFLAAAFENFGVSSLSELMDRAFDPEFSDRVAFVKIGKDPVAKEAKIVDAHAAKSAGVEKFSNWVQDDRLVLQLDGDIFCNESKKEILGQKGMKFVAHKNCSSKVKNNLQQKPFTPQKIHVLSASTWGQLTAALEEKIEDQEVFKPHFSAKTEGKKEPKAKEYIVRIPLSERTIQTLAPDKADSIDKDANGVAILQFKVSQEMFQIYQDMQDAFRKEQENQKLEAKADKERQHIKKEGIKFDDRRKFVQKKIIVAEEKIVTTPLYKQTGEREPPVAPAA